MIRHSLSRQCLMFVRRRRRRRREEKRGIKHKWQGGETFSWDYDTISLQVRAKKSRSLTENVCFFGVLRACIRGLCKRGAGR